VQGDSYASTFSFQRELGRRVFEFYKLEPSGKDLFENTRIAPSEFKEGMTLEVGCGYGRFLRSIREMGGSAIGVDLSRYSLELARENVEDDPKVGLVHADLFRLPFKEKVFPRVLSIGVLHHTPSTHEAFRRLPRLVSPGGKLAIFVYERYSKLVTDLHRRWILRLPLRVAYLLLAFNQIAFHPLRRVPILRPVLTRLFPCNVSAPRWQIRVCGDFDNYTPRYAWSHKYTEVFSWFEEAGLRNITIQGPTIWMTGTKA